MSNPSKSTATCILAAILMTIGLFLQFNAQNLSKEAMQGDPAMALLAWQGRVATFASVGMFLLMMGGALFVAVIVRWLFVTDAPSEP